MSDHRSPRKRTIESDDENSSGEEVFASSSPKHQSSPAPSSLASSPRAQQPPSSPAIPFEEDTEENEERKYMNNNIDDLEDKLEEQTGVDLIGDEMSKDYKSKPEQDRYDPEQLDDNEYDALSDSEKRKVDEILDARDKLRRKKLAGEGNLDLDEGENLNDVPRDEYGLPIQRRRRRHGYEEDTEHYFDDVDPLTEELSLDALSEVKAPSILEWITMPNVARSIARELKSFLLEYTDEKGRSVYGSRIRTLGEMNSESLEVSYMHLLHSKAILALFFNNVSRRNAENI
ncbi:hypothetical protein HII13_000042 [Brettanomyces bruxellensis]|nr:hypothetical protein HII13_000042 [Brettanomyces bruxellensis]